MERRITVHAERRIKEKNYRDRMNTIRDLSGIPQRHFERFYQVPLVSLLQIATHVNDDELLLHFDSVIVALKLRRSLMLPVGLDAESVNAKRDLWTYGIFVSSLLFGLNRVFAYSVVVAPEHAEKSYRWNPFDPPIPPVCDIAVQKLEPFSKAFNALMMHKLFDNDCITWLCRDLDVFNTVLKLIVTPSPRDVLGSLILTSHGVTPKKGKKLHHHQSNKLPISDAGQPDISAEKKVETHQKIISDDAERKKENSASKIKGDQGGSDDDTLNEFETWLVDAIKKGTHRGIMCDLSDGVALADPSIFREFMSPKDFRALKDSFLKRVGPLKQLPKCNFNGGVVGRALVLPKSWAESH